MPDDSVGYRQIFISYRAGDTGETSSALARELRQVFGSDRVFIDHLRIDPGSPFPDAILTALGQAAVVLVMIGTTWLTAQDRYGVRRLDVPEDWVRREVELSLKGSATVLPVLVEAAEPVPAGAFAATPTLQPLTRLQTLRLRRKSWDADLARLCERIAECGIPQRPPDATVTAMMGAAGLLEAAVTVTADQARRTALERLFTDLERVHRDYLEMFESIQDRLPDPWEQGILDYPKRVRAAAARLRQLRLAYEPVRVKVRAVAGALEGVELSTPERIFVATVLAYFPTGELRPLNSGGTSGTAVLAHLYRYLAGELGPELPNLVRETLATHRERWLRVCRAYAAMQLEPG
jgi:hypothetical protein